MKKSLMLLGAMTISTFMFAQQDAAPQMHRGNRGESMKTVLSLDDKQMSSIGEINKKYHEEGKEQRKGLNEQRQAEISKVLTPEQNKKWTDYKKERADKFAKARDERVQKRLSLSDDQLKTLKSTLSEEQYNKLAFGGQRYGRHHGGKRGK
jgi:hypothetical protein